MHPVICRHQDEPTNGQAGFTLLEVLVSLVVLSMALLGIANLQLAGLRLAQDGIYRTQAALLAFDMSQRVLANKLANQAATNFYRGNASVAFAVDCATASCTASQMADYDTVQWQTMIALRIPNGSDGSVTGAAPNYTFSVNWWDRAGEELLTEEVGDPTQIAVEVYAP